MDNETLLFDRLEMIKTTINKYGEGKFYISFSGGKDSTVLHYLVDMALPDNKIPRVFSNTGIEYEHIVKFVKEMAEQDDRFITIYPHKNIKKTLEEVGYPFKSKEHSTKLGEFQKGNKPQSVMKYANIDGSNDGSRYACPKILRFQFDDDYPLRISEKCCHELKKKPFKKWSQENGKSITMTGMRAQEGGQREHMNCIVTKKDKVVKFHPLAVITEEFENWFIDKYQIKLADLYYPPFNFERTGCKGCPFNLQLQKQLDVMEKLLPREKEQCELIWKPVYDEYRRLGYRLRKEEKDG